MPEVNETPTHQMPHNDCVALMEKNYQKTGKYIDPKTGKEFPPGRKMMKDPNRSQRRALEQWRKQK